MRFGVLELLIILMIIIVIFGPKQLPKLAKALTSSIHSFKEGIEKKDGDKTDEEQ